MLAGFAFDGLSCYWILGIISQYLPEFADGRIDAVIGIEEDVLTPNSFNDLLAGADLKNL
jgi:hypothetical protein